MLSEAEVRDLDKFVKLGLLGGWFARWGRVMVDVRRKDRKYLVLRSKRDVQALLAGLNSAAKAPKEGEGSEDMASPAVGDAGRPGSGTGHGVHRF